MHGGRRQSIAASPDPRPVNKSSLQEHDQADWVAEAERGAFPVVQQSISFGDSSDKVAAAAAAAQRAMQEQELAELVSLGFDEADAKVRFGFAALQSTPRP